MPQPVAGYRSVQPWDEFSSEDGGAPPGGAPACRWPQQVPDIPDPPDAKTASGVVGTSTISAASRDARDVAIQRKLDAFLSSMTATYRTSEGEARVAVPFFMSRGPDRGGARDGGRPPRPAALAELQSAARRAHVESALGQIRGGRGTPEQIRALTQALLDEGHLPSGERSVRDRVRQMMFDFGIGIDCAGYVQQAYLAASGLDRHQARLQAPGSESLSNLGPRGFKRITDASDVRPGDIFVCGAPPRSPVDLFPVGHCAIVREQRLASAADLQDLLHQPGAAAFAVGTIRVFDVDSSFGCHDNALVGGARRERWWHNETTGQWAWLAQGDGTPPRPFCVTPTPYDHPFNPPDSGVFRGRMP